MKLLDAKTTADLVKLVVFVVVTTLATSLLVVMVGLMLKTIKAGPDRQLALLDGTGAAAPAAR